jgi:DNA-binding phage protein
MTKIDSLKESVSTKIKMSELASFGAAEHLKTDEDIALYISIVIKDGDLSHEPVYKDLLPGCK